MAKHYSFQDELARQRAEADQKRDQADRSAAHERMADYRKGQAIAADLIQRIAVGGRDHQESANSLRKSAQQQPGTLDGRVAAGELAAAAQGYQAEADRQRPVHQAEAELTALRMRIAREHAAHQGATYQESYERHREPER